MQPWRRSYRSHHDTLQRNIQVDVKIIHVDWWIHLFPTKLIVRYIYMSNSNRNTFSYWETTNRFCLTVEVCCYLIDIRILLTREDLKLYRIIIPEATVCSYSQCYNYRNVRFICCLSKWLKPNKNNKTQILERNRFSHTFVRMSAMSRATRYFKFTSDLLFWVTKSSQVSCFNKLAVVYFVLLVS